MNVLIAGGGVGGLTTALCLARFGIKATIFEASPQLNEPGAGLQLSPNCSRVLHNLGLEKRILKKSSIPSGMQFREWDSGRIIGESELGIHAVERYGYPYYQVHRQDLIKFLADAAEDDPNIEIQKGVSISGFSQNNGSVTLLAAGKDYHGDLLIGADGIHSIVREGLWGQKKARFTGNVAWRALVPANCLPKGFVLPVTTAWWGPKKHFVHYYVRGGELVNCVCVVEKKGWEKESWNERGDYDELKSDFVGWHGDIQKLLDNADRKQLFKWALFDREPMSRWGEGRVTLLGDACHPMLPFMAQGAAMAIEDAAVLARCLSGKQDIPNALLKYEDLRRKRTASVQRNSRLNASVFHFSGVKAWARNRLIKTLHKRMMDRLYSYDALKVVTLK